MDITFDLVGRRAFGAAFAIVEIDAMHGSDVAVGILVVTGALDHITVAQAHAIARRIAYWRIQAEIAFGRRCHEIFLLYPQRFGNREMAQAFIVLRMRWR